MPSCKSCTEMHYSMELPCVLLLAVSLLSVKADIQVQIVNEDVNIYRNINESLFLNCTVTTDDGQPPSSIKWEKDTKDINATQSSNNWAVKVIKHISRSDAGYYKCIASKDSKEENSWVYVNVKGKPMIFKSGEPELFSTKNVLVVDGALEDLKCHATGSKTITFRWLKGWKEIMPEMNGFRLVTGINGKTLQMTPVTKDKQGLYTCEARNQYGMDTYRILVIVKDRTQHPILQAAKSLISSYIGQTSKFVCYGKNIKKVYAATAWYFNGKEIPEETIENCSRLCGKTSFGKGSNKTDLTMSLVLNQTTLQDAGNYTCRVAVNQKTFQQTTLLVVKRKATQQGGDKKMTTGELVGVVAGILVFLIIAISIFKLIIYWEKRNKMDYPEIPQGSFKYGAFITYNSQDFNWVETNLLPLLEENGIEVCIHYRNFEPGIPIAENMVNSVYRSRVVIVAMSNNYMKSKYCRAELDYAVHRSLEQHGTNPLIILRIDPTIKKDKLPKEIKNKTFLDITSNVEKSTWEKRLLKYIQCDDDKNEDVNDNVREENGLEEHKALIQGHEDNGQKDDMKI